jgi:GrpB-like predicted nucleotidyltransferase (UPF0157 family)
MADPLGLESKTVKVVPYDSRWPSLFAAEAKRIVDAVSAAELRELTLEHVGSTAVPGLAAKPILDVAAGYGPGTGPLAYVAVFEALGYVYRGDRGLPGREFFRLGALRSHHLHLVALDGTHWARLLRFRDALRGDSVLRDRYAALKQSLALRYPRDREAYMLGKSEFVEAFSGLSEHREA